MTPPETAPRTEGPRTGAPAATSPRSAERLLLALGADPAFADAVLGDLAEEYVERAARDGPGAARRWYAREALRSAPHLVASAVRHTVRHGSARARARLAACGAAVALTLAAVAAAVLARNGPPARLVAGSGNGADGIVVNNVRPVQLPMRVLDRAGHPLKADSVRYRRVAGAPIAVSPQGVVTCTQRGDATVRASLGPIATHVAVRCRPVQELRASSWLSFVAGDSARHLPFVAVGVDGRPVTQLRGAVRVLDSSVATLAGAGVRPRAVGQTAVAVDVGDEGALIRVTVHEPVRSFAGLRPDQRFVAVRVRLARGDTVHWPLPRGVFWLKYLPRRPGEPPPTVSVDGLIACTPGDGIQVYRLPLDQYARYCVVHQAGATVTAAHGPVGDPVVEGALALERVEHR